MTDSLHAYQISKRGNSLRVMAEAVRWGKRGARVNTIGPGITMTPLAKDELTGPRGEGYRRMIELSAAGRAGTPDEVGTVGALLMGPEGGFITGSDFLMDGGRDRRLLVRRPRFEVSPVAARRSWSPRMLFALVEEASREEDGWPPPWPNCCGRSERWSSGTAASWRDLFLLPDRSVQPGAKANAPSGADCLNEPDG